MTPERFQYLKRLNALFDEYEFGVTANSDDFSFLKDVVTDDINGGRISTQLSRKIWPPLHQGEFYHYTTKAAAENILSSCSLRLTSLKKRIGEDEIREFLGKFNYHYPLEIDPETSRPRYVESLTQGYYYISFTDTEASLETEEYFWSTFAGHDGARFKFRLQVETGFLRKLVYGSDIDRWAEFFRRMSDLTRTELQKEFFWADAGVVCALYLPAEYLHERESRLVIHSSWGLDEKTDGASFYVELQFGLNEKVLVTLDLMEVQSDLPLSIPKGTIQISRTHGF